MEVSSEFHFCAAHLLPHHPGACRNLHGHNYRLVVTLAGALDPRTGMVCDFFTLRRVVSERILARLDHSDLNAVIENPTAENIAMWIWRELVTDLPQLRELVLYETHDCWVRYRGEPDAPA